MPGYCERDLGLRDQFGYYQIDQGIVTSLSHHHNMFGFESCTKRISSLDRKCGKKIYYNANIPSTKLVHSVFKYILLSFVASFFVPHSSLFYFALFFLQLCKLLWVRLCIR